MIWLTWRQFRAQTLLASAALAVLAVILVITGPQLVHLYDTSVATCQVHGDCQAAAAALMSRYSFLRHLGGVLVIAAPVILGMFWGAPLVARELEAGTQTLAWNQSITRTRWLVVKLSLTGLAAMASAGLFSLMVTWWSSPLDTASLNWLTPGVFVQRGIAPAGYAAFAFALGVTAGVLFRRTVPAMAATLAVFTAVQVVVPRWVRPHLIAPLRSISALSTANINNLNVSSSNGGGVTVTAGVNQPGAWVLSNQTIDTAGHSFTGPATQACLSKTASPQACAASLGQLHLRQLVTYQPASRFWAFQWYETAIFAALALALAVFCIWWVRRRRLS